MSNNFDVSLISSIVSANGMAVLGKVLAPFSAFTTDFSSDVVAAQGIVKVPLGASAATVNVDPSSFAAGNTTLSAVAVNMKHYSVPFGLTSKELNQGHALASLVKINAQAFANKLWQVVAANFTTANGFSTGTIPAAASFAVADVATPWGYVVSTDKALILDTAHYAKLIPTSTQSIPLQEGAYGFSKGVWYTNDTTTMQASAVGIVAAPTAVAIATAVPAAFFGGELLDEQTIMLEDLGIAVKQYIYSDGNRGLTCSFDIAMGTAPGDTSAGRILLNA